MSVHTTRDQPSCGFCDGTGQWMDPDADPADVDPCPLCDGSGTGQRSHVLAAAEAPEGDAPALAQIVALLPRLAPAQRQRLYEILHAQYDCRIYRG